MHPPRFSVGGCAGLALLALIFLVVPLHAAPKAPAWVTLAASQPPGFDYGKASASVLLDDSEIEVDARGTVTRRCRWLVKVLAKEGREYALAKIPYNNDATRVVSLQAWLVRGSGEVVVYDKKHATDIAAYSSGTLYSEARYRTIDATNEAGTGSVFAYEVVLEDKSVFNQHVWTFQAEIPVELSRVAVTVPQDWQVSAIAFNHDPVEPVRKNRTSTWQLSKLTPRPDEPMAPTSHHSAAWLAIDLRPAPGSKAKLLNFASWQDVSAHFTPVYETASRPNPVVTAKAAELVAGCATPWERIAALCRFAQKVNYISIFMNSSAAGGMIPRDAADVLRSNYGDCKDKASLLRALLRAQGIVSHPLTVCSGDPNRVRPEWPSPLQFNHAILAIAVDESVDVPALLVHPEFGRLVIFDPTNANTPPGWLAEEDCGGRGLLLAGPKGCLVDLPALRKEHNRVERKIHAVLHNDGTIMGKLEERFIGLASTDTRRRWRDSSPTDFRNQVERRIGRSLANAKLGEVEFADDFDRGVATLKTEFGAPQHGKPMRGTLLVFKPVLLSRQGGTSLKKEKRTQPVVIDGRSLSEKSVIALPAGFQVDELPPTVEWRTSFGSYRARVTIEDGNLVVERTEQYDTALVPASDYESVRLFFEKIQRSENTPVVLRRVPSGSQ